MAMAEVTDIFIDKLDVSEEYKEKLKELNFYSVNNVLLYLLWDRLGGTIEVDQPSGTSWCVDTESAGWR